MAYGRNRKKLQMKLIGLIGAVLVMALMQSDFYAGSLMDRTMNYSSRTLLVGERFRLKPRLLVHGKVNYSSSNIGVAIVYPNGIVEAIRPGRTVIVAEIGDEEYYCRIKVRSSK